MPAGQSHWHVQGLKMPQPQSVRMLSHPCEGLADGVSEGWLLGCVDGIVDGILDGMDEGWPEDEGR